ncbi:hypothetical protein A2U01_0059971, partial [Trifolium medium]|nr:hypothetical protein [Trifolium medium]
HATVAELVDETGAWNWNELNTWLPPELLLRFRSFPPPNRDYGCDERMGTRDQSADFVVSDMYKILSEVNNMEANSRWSKLWKLRVPERV